MDSCMGDGCVMCMLGTVAITTELLYTFAVYVTVGDLFARLLFLPFLPPLLPFLPSFFSFTLLSLPSSPFPLPLSPLSQSISFPPSLHLTFPQDLLSCWVWHPSLVPTMILTTLTPAGPTPSVGSPSSSP